jgi:hypothetical protein
LIALGRHNEALTLARAAVAVLDKALGPEHQSTKDSASTCADALDELGRYALVWRQATRGVFKPQRRSGIVWDRR